MNQIYSFFLCVTSWWVCMIFGGFQKVSLIDYPGKICAIAFTIGCNFRCPYCHNVSLVLPEIYKPKIIDESYILNYLKHRKKYIDALEVTGGEPTLHRELPLFLKKVKNLGFLVKLDTNGTNPEMLLDLIEQKLVDYVAMDIKAPLARYNYIVRADVNVKNIERSIHILINNSRYLDYEFRTTVGPWLTIEDFHKIGEAIKGAKKYYIQQFVNKLTLVPEYKQVMPFSKQQLQAIKEIMMSYVEYVEIRD